MSRSDEGRSAPDRSPKSNSVGYGCPPAEYRFKKGQSGNPKGRPRKSKVPKRPSLEIGLQPANELLMQEAYRPVTLKEGDQTITLPAIQAVFRAMGISAMKGNRGAQRNLADLVRQVEEADRQLRMEFVETMITYKCRWEENLEEAERLGLPAPEPIPHPDDVFIDLKNGNAFVCGPWTKEEKALYDRQLCRRADAQEEVSLMMEQHQKARKQEKRAFWLEQAHLEQRIFDIINDNLPPRYRTTLKDRSWAEGASRPGSQKKSTWPNEEG